MPDYQSNAHLDDIIRECAHKELARPSWESLKQILHSHRELFAFGKPKYTLLKIDYRSEDLTATMGYAYSREIADAHFLIRGEDYYLTLVFEIENGCPSFSGADLTPKTVLQLILSTDAEEDDTPLIQLYNHLAENRDALMQNRSVISYDNRYLTYTHNTNYYIDMEKQLHELLSYISRWNDLLEELPSRAKLIDIAYYGYHAFVSGFFLEQHLIEMLHNLQFGVSICIYTGGPKLKM